MSNFIKTREHFTKERTCWLVYSKLSDCEAINIDYISELLEDIHSDCIDEVILSELGVPVELSVFTRRWDGLTEPIREENGTVEQLIENYRNRVSNWREWKFEPHELAEYEGDAKPYQLIKLLKELQSRD